jgi:hemolysin activation/secretion protein
MGAVGVGLRGNWQQLQLRLDLARAMTTASSTHKGDSRVHAALAYQF